MFHRQIIFPQQPHAYYHVPSIAVAPDGGILAFCEERWRSPCDDTGECRIVMKKSMDGGDTWSELSHLHKKAGAKYHMGSVVTVPRSGSVLLMCGGGWLKSLDNGDAWQKWRPTMPGMQDASTHGSSPGIILRHGIYEGRILWPARAIVSQTGYNDSSIRDRREKCYSIALYSDDDGQTINASNTFLQGTGEACLAEGLDGEIYFNARAYFDDGKRRTAVSQDGGGHFSEIAPATNLRELSQGCNAAMVRYPPELCGGRDILLFVNPDTTGQHREHGVVHVSHDGGRTWPLKKEIGKWGDWFDYASMAVAKDGTVLVMYKTTPAMQGLGSSTDGRCSMALARFNLAWIVS